MLFQISRSVRQECSSRSDLKRVRIHNSTTIHAFCFPHSEHCSYASCLITETGHACSITTVHSLTPSTKAHTQTGATNIHVNHVNNKHCRNCYLWGLKFLTHSRQNKTIWAYGMGEKQKSTTPKVSRQRPFVLPVKTGCMQGSVLRSRQRDVRFSQECYWRCRSCGMWRYVVGCEVPDNRKELMPSFSEQGVKVHSRDDVA